ncbi:type 1 glutamine amidotransferase [Flavisolibacter ginsengisoli]|jgi:GMP synthase-like glutamine amidotransferase|uniref:GMP synthase-Glutamine amidotransferase n=1 Tax=Flavisolibacter ginsengisoli DSM 18119 TaxID=1121884 RepID=A0A1M5F1I0_9BACT|nr:GMP synthase [Flavisolibacter ginsengisoli]SHF85365.1 GMP synthase-Glutamine amidotransferase [Flavisolibacter ginsengisoli DSM 18119]
MKKGSTIRIAILDLYEGHPNQGMRCLREIIKQWAVYSNSNVVFDEFEVRLNQEFPDLSYDMYISSGGPGSPMESEGQAWDTGYFTWLEQVEQWNNNPANPNKKFVFFICHSFQLVSRYYGIGDISKRKSTAFGVFPVHVTLEGQKDPVFAGLNDPFYVVDSRDWQVTLPDFNKLKMIGAEILCIEKYRPHVPYAQAIMGVRFNEYMVGTQFHPEADAEGMSMYLQTEEKKKTVVENYGFEKWQNMVEQLNDPEKIMYTYAHLLPNFFNEAARHLQQQLVVS